MNTTDRVKEIIRDHFGLAGSTPATDVLDEEFVIIPRSDLPDFKIIDRKGEPHVDCGSDWGTWNVKHVDRMRETALEYVGAWLTAEKWRADEAERESAAKAHALNARRDELATEFTIAENYAEMGPGGQRLVDRIIELEQQAAA